MIVDSIKTVLGTDLAAKVEDALKGKGKDGKDLDLVVGNDGSFVPSDKHEGVKGQAAAAENTMKAVAEALKDIGGSGDTTKLAEDVKKAQATIEKLNTDHASELSKIKMGTALKMALAGKVHDPADVVGLLDTTGFVLDDKGDLATDLAPLLEPIQKAKPYLFLEENQDPNAAPNIKGAKPAEGGKPAQEPAAQSGPTIF